MTGDHVVEISPARAEDLAAIAALLQEAELPSADFAQLLERFLVARAEGRVVGAVGCEVGGAHALLRSLVVAPEWRGKGLGGRLVDRLERLASTWGVEQWWLLTTTAEAFFAARGFRVVPRCAAPETVRATGQFNGGCGEAAVCLTRECAGGAGRSRCQPG
jgi:amino-acid N-acetyltransferase